MKPLLPSLREKKRYLAIEIFAPRASPRASFEALRASFRTIIGSIAAGKANLKLIAEKSLPERIIVRVHRDYVDSVRASICLLQTIESQHAQLRTVRVSGSLSTAEAS